MAGCSRWPPRPVAVPPPAEPYPHGCCWLARPKQARTPPPDQSAPTRRPPRLYAVRVCASVWADEHPDTYSHHIQRGGDRGPPDHQECGDRQRCPGSRRCSCPDRRRPRGPGSPLRPDRTAPDPGPWSSSVVAGTRAPARQPAPRDPVAVATVRTRTRKAPRPALSAVLSAPVRQIGRSRPRRALSALRRSRTTRKRGRGAALGTASGDPRVRDHQGSPPSPSPASVRPLPPQPGPAGCWPCSPAPSPPRPPLARFRSSSPWPPGCMRIVYALVAPRVYAYRVCAGREARSCGNTPERTVTATHRKPTREGRCDPPTTRASVFTVGVLV